MPRRQLGATNGSRLYEDPPDLRARLVDEVCEIVGKTLDEWKDRQ